MSDLAPGPRSLERRDLRRQQRINGLLVGIAFLLGALAGWLVLGWLLFPARPSVKPSVLSASSRLDFVEMTVDSWLANGDVSQARERLGSFSSEELGSMLAQLRAARELSGDKPGADRLAALAAALGVSVDAAAVGAPTRTPMRIALAPAVPPGMQTLIRQWAADQGHSIVAEGENPDVLISVEPQPGAILLAERVYVVVDRFATLRSDITLSQARGLWQGRPTADGANTFLVTDDAAEALTLLLGAPGPNVRRMPFDALVNSLWNDPTALAVVPFDRLVPRLAALKLDSQNVLTRDLRLEQYPLATRIYASGRGPRAQELVLGLRPKVARTNRDPERLTTLIMTGTTAIARTAAYRIEQKQDPAYPARLIGPTLAAADITHISNEIPFVDDCQPALNTMVFCSKPSYLATFKLAGVKIVGLTGNHLLDYGTERFVKTLDTYRAAGLRYYGGGRNATEASQTLLLTDHGNRLAFLGANSFGPSAVWATAQQPGAQRYDSAALKRAIEQARKQADVVLVELQAEETYDYQPSHNNQVEFRATLADGADVVTGVMAHQPQAFEFDAEGRRLILYGLGNLFFDQMFELGVRQELIARHTIYQGHLLQTELLTAMLEDSVQPRWMTPAERAALLNSLFQASGWQAAILPRQ